MKFKRLSITLLALILVVGFIVACSSDTSTPDASQGTGSTGGTDSSGGSDSSTETAVTGGTLNVAYLAQPGTIDPHMTTANATRDPARLIYETLITLNENFEVATMLAESYDVSETEPKITFKLRNGVKFHNGEDMTAEDVVASMTKWGQSSFAKANLGEHEWVAIDEYTVELNYEKKSFVVLHVLAEPGQFAAIMPKEIAEAANAKGATEYIGTGPFQLEEWRQDQYMLFKKFDDYQSVDDTASGLAGNKQALVDDIYFHFVPDESTRINGLLSGQYDFAHMLPYDGIPQLDAVPNVVVDIWPFGPQTLIFNKEGKFGDVNLRQAVNHALDNVEVLTAAFTSPDYYDMSPSLFIEDQVDWYTDAGIEYYNVNDPEKAKKYLEKAGYNGEEVVILTSRDYAHHYNAAVATQQALENIGMKTKLDVYDWATLLERRAQKDKYDIFYTAFPVMATPHQYIFLDSRAQWPGWTNNPEIDGLLDEIKAVSNQEDAKTFYADLQQELWEDVPIINVGKSLRVSAYGDHVQGYTEFLGPVFWNTTVNK